MTSALLPVAAILAYLASGYLFGRRLLVNASPAAGGIVALAALALGLHLATLLLAPGNLFDPAFFRALSLVAFAVMAMSLCVSLIRPVLALGAVVCPIAAVSIALDFALTPADQASASANWQVRLHVIIALWAYAVLSLSALQALLLAAQEKALREKRLTGLVRALPALSLMESLFFQLVGVGFFLLSLTLLSGVLFVHDLFAQHLVHKTVLSIVAWCLFGGLLFMHWRWGLRGRRAARWALAGMLVLLLAFFGSKFVLELVLQRP